VLSSETATAKDVVQVSLNASDGVNHYPEM
jgi:hypothetical protein